MNQIDCNTYLRRNYHIDLKSLSAFFLVSLMPPSSLSRSLKKSLM